MIKTVKGRDTLRLYEGRRVSRFSGITRQAERRLALLHAAPTLDALAALPGNRLEALRGDRRGQHSIRINDQWRLCFIWRDSDAYDVEIVDYHR